MFAAVDLGSNSFRLHVGQQVGSRMQVVRSARDPIRLAAGLDRNGMLTAPAIEIALRCLRAFAAVLAEYRLSGVRVVATNTLRVARNAAAFLPLAEEALGYPIDIISGEEEGRLIYMGVAHVLAAPNERRLVIDIGGGSTEVVLGLGAEVRAVESFGIGTQPQGSIFFPDGAIDAASFEAAVLSARARFEDAAALFPPGGWSAAYGSSGTIRAIADVIARNGIDGGGDGALTLDSLDALRRRLVACGRIERFDLPGVKPQRAIVMAGGLTILIAAMLELGIERVEAVEAGLRLGALCDLEMRANQYDRRDAAVIACMGRFGVDPERAGRTALLASRLHACLADSERYTRLLGWSCLLHETGHAVSATGAHKHAAYIVENADLPGFTRGEQRQLGMLVLGQKGNLRKVREAVAEPAFACALLALRLAAMMMHARLDGDIEALRVRTKGRSGIDRIDRIDLTVPRDWKRRHPTAMYWLQKEQECWGDIGVLLSVGAN